MRHGRKNRSHRFDGYKRHIARDLDSGLVRVVGLTAANAPVASVTDDLLADLTHQDVQLGEIHLDRGYLASSLVQNRPEDLLTYCKAWPVRNGDRYAKTAFTLEGNLAPSAARTRCAFPSVPVARCTSRSASARSAPCGNAAPPVPLAAASTSTLMNGSCRSYVPDS